MMAVCGNTLWLLGGVVEVRYHPCKSKCSCLLDLHSFC